MNETVAHRVAQVARQEFEMILAREGRRPVQPGEDRAREEIDSRTCLRATLWEASLHGAPVKELLWIPTSQKVRRSLICHCCLHQFPFRPLVPSPTRNLRDYLLRGSNETRQRYVFYDFISPDSSVGYWSQLVTRIPLIVGIMQFKYQFSGHEITMNLLNFEKIQESKIP